MRMWCWEAAWWLRNKVRRCRGHRWRRQLEGCALAAFKLIEKMGKILRRVNWYFSTSEARSSNVEIGKARKILRCWTEAVNNGMNSWIFTYIHIYTHRYRNSLSIPCTQILIFTLFLHSKEQGSLEEWLTIRLRWGKNQMNLNHRVLWPKVMLKEWWGYINRTNKSTWRAPTSQI